MKEIVIFGSYSDTERKQQILERNLDMAKEMGVDTLVYAHYALPKRIQDKCTYYIFDVSNPVFENAHIHVWNILFFKRQIFVKQKEYGYAAIQQIPRALGFANTLDYDIAYWFVYDVDISELPKWRDEFKQKIFEGNEVLYNYFYRVQNGEPEGISGIYSVFKVKNVWEKIKGGINKNHYQLMITYNDQFIAESYLKYIYNLVDLKTYHLEDKPIFLPSMDSTGDRTLGKIPDDLFPETKKYFGKCFVGKNIDDGKSYIEIWDFYMPIDTITINFGTYTQTFTPNESNIKDDSRLFEFEITPDITQVEIIEVNGNPVNEMLDSNISPSLFDIHIIREDCYS